MTVTEKKPNRIQGMVRSIEQYRNGDPKAIMAGSHAQALFALTDARNDILALWGKLEELAAAEPSEPVGEAGEMPGSNGGFTMAAFKAADVPVGTKLYTSPTPAPADRGAVEALRKARAALPNPDAMTGKFAEVRNTIDAALAALALRAAEVKVKPLTWKPTHDGRYAACIRPDHFTAENYTVHKIRGGWVIDDGRFTFLRQTFDTLDAAKAAAQSHHDARILSALAAPSQAREGA